MNPTVPGCSPLPTTSIHPLDRIGRMTSRVFALLLAAVMLWSGLGTAAAAPVLAASPAGQGAGVALVDAAPASGAEAASAAEALLDDRPSQASIDPAAETPGLLPAPLKSAATFFGDAGACAFVATGPVAPFLAGPLRPPCGAPRAA